MKRLKTRDVPTDPSGRCICRVCVADRPRRSRRTSALWAVALLGAVAMGNMAMAGTNSQSWHDGHSWEWYAGCAFGGGMDLMFSPQIEEILAEDYSIFPLSINFFVSAHLGWRDIAQLEYRAELSLLHNINNGNYSSVDMYTGCPLLLLAKVDPGRFSGSNREWCGCGDLAGGAGFLVAGLGLGASYNDDNGDGWNDGVVLVLGFDGGEFLGESSGRYFGGSVEVRYTTYNRLTLAGQNVPCRFGAITIAFEGRVGYSGKIRRSRHY